MFCNNCGNQLPEQAAFCSNCGSTLGQSNPSSPSTAAPSGPNLGQLIGGEVKARSLDAWKGIKLFAKSPVGGLQASFQSYEPTRALWVAGIFSVIYLVFVLFGLYRILDKPSDALSFFIHKSNDLSVKQVSQAILVALTPVATLAVSASLSRKIFRGHGSFIGDFFIASASLLPFGFLVLLASILGLANLELVAALAVFALTYTLLMLYAGCSRISGIPESGAAPAVPTMVLLTAWLTKVVVTTVLS